MPDLDLIKQGEQGVRDRRGWFAKGRSDTNVSAGRVAAATKSTALADPFGNKTTGSQATHWHPARHRNKAV
jgi:hypothetical protein